ncbi:MAG: hypothetical protein ACRD5W_05745 [Candidatus Acidiferrales bacterium]
MRIEREAAEEWSLYQLGDFFQAGDEAAHHRMPRRIIELRDAEAQKACK